MEQAPKTQFVFLNRTSKLWCPVKGAPAPYIVWRKNGVAVQKLNQSSKLDQKHERQLHCMQAPKSTNCGMATSNGIEIR